MKRPKEKKNKPNTLKKHPLGNKKLASKPIQQGNIVAPASVGPGKAASVSSTGNGTIKGA